MRAWLYGAELGEQILPGTPSPWERHAAAGVLLTSTRRRPGDRASTLLRVGTLAIYGVSMSISFQLCRNRWPVNLASLEQDHCSKTPVDWWQLSGLSDAPSLTSIGVDPDQVSTDFIRSRGVGCGRR